jgi:glycosyltransferase involved in cell wall biosynthesis
LRERGFTIEVASINPPDRPSTALPLQEREEAVSTFYVKPGTAAQKLLALGRLAIIPPQVLFRGLRTALGLGKRDPNSRLLALFYLAEALLVGAWMRRRSLTHLHVHFGGPVATVGLLVAAAWKLPWSLTLHGPDEFFDQTHFLLERKIEAARFVFCISDYGRSQVLRIAPTLDPSRVETLYLGVDCHKLHPQSAEPISPPLQIVCIGRLVAAKGHRVLLDALARLPSTGDACKALLIGDGAERAALEAHAHRLHLTGSVAFAGALDHASTLHLLAKAHVFVLASFAEGLPVALMEAMALGVPCVSTFINGVPELIANGENGLLVPAGNVEELSRALERLLKDADLRHSMGIKARQTVTDRFNLATNQDLLASAFRRRLLGGRL